MNKQKLIEELNTEIDRLTKARDLLKGGESVSKDGEKLSGDSLELFALLRDDGPLRRGDIMKLVGWSPDRLTEVIRQTNGVRTYGKGWVDLVNNEKTA